MTCITETFFYMTNNTKSCLHEKRCCLSINLAVGITCGIALSECIILSEMRKDTKNNLFQIISYQALFWTALFLFGLAQSYSPESLVHFREIVIYDLCHLLFQIMSANVIYYYLIIRFFDHKRYGLFFISLPVVLYLMSVINRIFIVYAAEPFFMNEPKDSMRDILTDLNYLLSYYVFPIITASFIFVCFMYILRYKNEKQTRIDLQKEKSELELKILKSHLNPHFLFNTLNNIYSLSVNHPEKTPKSIAGLADIFDYVIYKGPQKMIRIAEEINTIDRYIELQELRFGDNLKIIRTVQLHSENWIPPLLYLSLVENAFKHGNHNTDGNLTIILEFHADEVKSVFRIRNSRSLKKSDRQEGIGLTNIGKQLELYYKNNFDLIVSHGEDWFDVKLITPTQND